MKKKIILTAFFSFALLMIFGMTVNAASNYYLTKATATSSQIEVSTSVLNKAKDNAKKYGSEFTNSAYISNEYDLHIYHFEAPKGGYYSFYTTGTTDTVIKVYEHQNFLWWTTKYLDRGMNDDGCRIDRRTNACFVLELTKDEDYYICVRAYGTQKGQYTLRVEGNEDKTNYTLSHGKYSHWEKTGTSWTSALAQSMGAASTYAKTYLTKDEVALFYWSLTSKYDIVDPKTGKVYTFDGLRDEYKKSTADGIAYFNTILSLLTTFAPNGVGAVATVVGFVISYAYEASTKTKEQMQKVLEDKCGAHRGYHSAQYIDGKYYVTDTIEASHGLCVANTYITTTDIESGFSWTFNSKDYETYDSDVRVGVKYEKGDWTK